MGEPIMVDVRRLLEQCDREDQNVKDRRFLYTAEIRALLGFGLPPDYSELEIEVENRQ